MRSTSRLTLFLFFSFFILYSPFSRAHASDPRFTDNGNGTIRDNVSGLIWLKDANCFGGKYWYDAITVSNALASGQCGLTDGSSAGDWHLPTTNEFASFYFDGYEYNKLNYAGFINVQPYYYWTSENYGDNIYAAQVVYLYKLYDWFYGAQKDINYLVWPVRSGSSGTTTISGTATIPTYSTSSNSSLTGASSTAPTHNNPSFHADPVNVATGSHVLERTLLSVNGVVPITISSRYDSLLLASGPMGKGWGHNFETTLTVFEGGNVQINWTANRKNSFTNDGSDNFSSTEAAVKFDTLIKNGSTGYTLTRKDGSVLTFNATGKLTQQKNRIGQALNLAYGESGRLSSITEPVANKSVVFSYDASNRVSTITDPLNRQVSFGYDTDSNLTSITDPTSKTITYTYNVDGRVLTAVDAEGNTIFTNTYDTAGRVATQDDALSSTTQLTTFNYDEAVQLGAVTTTVTERTGATKVLTHDTGYNLVKVKDELTITSSSTFDSDGNRLTSTDPNGNITSYTYDARGNLLTITDPKSRVTTMTYDTADNLLTAANSAGKVVTYTYDANNRVTSIKNPLNQTTSYTYNENGQLATTTDAKGGVTSYSYSSGLLTAITDPAGNVTSFGYDAAGRRISSTTPSAKTTTYEYDAVDNLIKVTDPLGHYSSFTYDSRHNRLTATDPRGAVTTYTYNGNNKLLSVKNALNQTTTFEYDAEDRLVKTTDPRGNNVTIAYDAAGRPTTTTDQLGNSTTVTYDSLGNPLTHKDAYNTTIQTSSYDPQTYQPLTVKDALLNTVTYGYDTLDRIVSITDPLSRIKQLQYDDLNRITQATDPKSGITTQGFDANSNRTAQKDPNNNQTAFTFDAANRLTGMTTAAGATNSLTYTNDLLTATTNGRSQNAAITYYNDGRVQAMTDPAGTISYTYDANGNLLTVSEGGKTSSYQYDLLNRVTSYTDGDANTLQYGYDANSNLTSVTYPDAKTVTYTYDAANRMTGVTDWASRATSYTYDKNGRLLTTTRPDGSIETRTWNAAGQLTQLKDTKADTTTLISQFDYTYDAAGNVVSEVNAAVTEPTITTASEALTYGADNRLATYKGQAVSYDADGNMTNGPLNSSMQTFNYDARNRLTSAGATTYSYDPQNNRISQTAGGQTTKYITNPIARLSQLLMEKDAGGTAKAWYVYGVGLVARQDAAGNYSIYHYDRRGSTVALTNAAGTVTDTYSYDPFGKLTASTGSTVQPFKYNGRDGVMTDANGLYYMRARYYNPTIKRFINMDSLLGSMEDSQSLNRYAYVNGNPVDSVDPFGLSADSDGLGADIYAGFKKGISTMKNINNYGSKVSAFFGFKKMKIAYNSAGNFSGMISKGGSLWAKTSVAMKSVSSGLSSISTGLTWGEEAYEAGDQIGRILASSDSASNKGAKISSEVAGMGMRTITKIATGIGTGASKGVSFINDITIDSDAVNGISNAVSGSMNKVNESADKYYSGEAIYEFLAR